MSAENPFREIVRNVNSAIPRLMEQLGETIANDARERLIAAGHVDTGALRDSIRAETETNGQTVTTYLYADAESEDGVQYGEFIELGSGAAHGRAGGRVGTWRYQDRNGQWHTTDGMDADPFMRPAIDEALEEFPYEIKELIDNVAKYAGRGKEA